MWPPATHLTVKPVVDLADHVHVDAYEVPDRIKERLALRDHHCVFPWCTAPHDHWTRTGRARRRPHHPLGTRGRGGPTSTCQLVPLCRSHHRHKTFAGSSITVAEPGTYHWSSPHGLGSAATTPAPNPLDPTPDPAVPPGRD